MDAGDQGNQQSLTTSPPAQQAGSCQRLPDNKLSGAALCSGRCVFAVKNSSAISSPHLQSQLASSDWPELFLTRKMRRNLPLQPAGRSILQQEGGNDVPPLSGRPGDRCLLHRLRCASDSQRVPAPDPEVREASDRVADLSLFCNWGSQSGFFGFLSDKTFLKI